MKNQLFGFDFPKQEEHPSPKSAVISTVGVTESRSLFIPHFLNEKRHFKGWIKRISPFLLLSLILPALFIYSFIDQEGSHLLQFCFLIFLEVNIIFTDFALWNYFRGKRKTNIWLMELMVILIAFSCFL